MNSIEDAVQRMARRSMDEAFKGTVGRKPASDEVLSMEKLLQAIDRLREPLPSSTASSDRSMFPPRCRIVTSDALTVSELRILSWWERFRVWVERLADEAEVYYHFPRVQRNVTKPSPEVLMIGRDTIVCHPAIYLEIRRRFPEATES